MTATVEGTTGAGTATGRIARVTGPVVDVEFPVGSMPAIYNALHTDVKVGGKEKVITLEVAQHLGDNLVRAISLAPQDGLVRGAEVRDTGSPISVPVGDVVKGHVFNTLGQPLDVDAAELGATEYWPIHRKAPSFDQLESKTGHRPAHAVRAWWQDRPVRWCRCGQDGAHPGDDHPYRP